MDYVVNNETIQISSSSWNFLPQLLQKPSAKFILMLKSMQELNNASYLYIRKCG